jgi:hypothetical protein
MQSEIISDIFANVTVSAGCGHYVPITFKEFVRGIAIDGLHSFEMSLCNAYLEGSLQCTLNCICTKAQVIMLPSAEPDSMVDISVPVGALYPCNDT